MEKRSLLLTTLCNVDLKRPFVHLHMFQAHQQSPVGKLRALLPCRDCSISFVRQNHCRCWQSACRIPNGKGVTPVHHVSQVDNKHAWPWLHINPGLANADLQAGLVVCCQDSQRTPVCVWTCTREPYHLRGYPSAQGGSERMPRNTADTDARVHRRQ